MRGRTRYGVLPVGGGGQTPPAVDPAPADAWWRAASRGCWEPEAVPLPAVTLAEHPARWCVGGGLRPGPRGAADLARRALAALPPSTDCPETVLLVVAGPVAPHVWRVAGGGVPVAPGRWVRRYAALPPEAGLGAWVHELAHLLLLWPDLPGSPCLMGAGARRGEGRDPAPPGPALALLAGWLDLLPADPVLPAAGLGGGQAMRLEWAGREILVTRDGAAFALHDRLRPGPPLATGRFADPAMPLLAAVAGALAEIGPS